MGLEQTQTDRLTLTTSKKRLLLVQPVPLSHNLLSGATVGGKLYPLGLFVLDALTPKEEWDVEIIDEGQKRIDTENLAAENFSLVGINSWTNQAPRAYEIAQAFKQRDIPVIMGGPHPSVRPEEALRYADSVCIGEAESVWTKILADVQNRGLQRIYHGEKIPLSQVPILNHPLRDKYICGSIQTARGCPHDCDYCSVTATNGAIIRYRPIADVIEEWRGIKQKIVVVTDDNFIGSGRRGRTRALDLCKALVELHQQGIRKYWGTQATHNLGQDNELLEWMHKAGCRLVLFGLDSLNIDVINEIGKPINTLGSYQENILNTQRHGIGVIGSFIFSRDSDTPDASERVLAFIKESKLAAQNLNIICPLPGTRLFNQVSPAGRLRYTNFPEDWGRYTLKEVVMQPKHGSPLDIYRERKRIEDELNNKFNLLIRTARTLWETKSLYAALLALAWNMGGRLHKHDYREQIKVLEEEQENQKVNIPNAVN